MTAIHQGHPHASDSVDTHESLHVASPETAFQAAVVTLRAAGERVTEERRAVLEVLARTPDHLSADQIVAVLDRTYPGVHRATVYRTVEMLAERGVVSSMRAPGGAMLYHLAATTAGHEHLHAHCRICGQVVVVAVDVLDAASASILRTSGFTVDALQSTLVGVCASCTAAAARR